MQQMCQFTESKKEYSIQASYGTGYGIIWDSHQQDVMTLAWISLLCDPAPTAVSLSV